MLELIEKSKVKLRLCAACYNNGSFACLSCVIPEIIKGVPTIEAEPVRHGQWETWGYVFHGIEWKRCSCCGKCADVSYYGLLDGEIRMSTPDTCGGCGAKMDATDTNVGGKGGADNGKTNT